MGRWTQTPPAGGRPGVAGTPASLQTPSAGTLAAVKTATINPGPPSSHANSPFPHQWAPGLWGEGPALGPHSESTDLDLSCPIQEPLATCGQRALEMASPN